MSTIFNFSAGPAVLPKEVLERAREEMTDWGGSGMSVMEMSHRGKEFLSIIDDAEKRLREILDIGMEYDVLFLQGGATSQFSLIPMNLLSDGQQADYVNTGQWSKKAISEAKKIANVNVAATSENDSYCSIPSFNEWDLSKDSGFIHITSNETIGGVEFHDYPDKLTAPLVADMSSNILSRRVDISKFGLIYAGAQKNIGPAGLTIVIIRKELLSRVPSNLPSMFSYAVQAQNQSMFNTPPTYAIYIAGLVFEWIQDAGGIDVIERINVQKSSKIYEEIDKNDFYVSPVQKQNRSRMNVPFRIHDESLEELFLSEAHANGLIQLKGHRSVGGIRASIYNAMTNEGVDALLSFMREFEKQKG